MCFKSCSKGCPNPSFHTQVHCMSSFGPFCTPSTCSVMDSLDRILTVLHFLKPLRVLVATHGLSMYTIFHIYRFAVFLDKIDGERF